MSIDAVQSCDSHALFESWREVATERERALEEQERLLMACQGTIARLQAANEELATLNRRLKADHLRLAERLAAEQREFAIMYASLAFRAAVGVRTVFPIDSRRGRLVRFLLRPWKKAILALHE